MTFDFNADLVADALEGATAATDPGELVHLAATSKVEHLVRDRMTWWLTTTLASRSVIVVREWPRRRVVAGVPLRRRVDLAVLSNTDPVAPLLLVEGKAHYHFDARKPGIGGYVEQVARDLAHLESWPDATSVAVVLSTHVGSSVPAHLAEVVAYASDANRLLSDFDGDANAARYAMRAIIDASYRTLGPTIGPITVADGTAWGINVTIDGWVVEPSA